MFLWYKGSKMPQPCQTDPTKMFYLVDRNSQNDLDFNKNSIWMQSFKLLKRFFFSSMKLIVTILQIVILLKTITILLVPMSVPIFKILVTIISLLMLVYARSFRIIEEISKISGGIKRKVPAQTWYYLLKTFFPSNRKSSLSKSNKSCIAVMVSISVMGRSHRPIACLEILWWCS